MRLRYDFSKNYFSKRPNEGLLTNPYECSHTFSGAISRTITIAGQNIIHLGCGNLDLTAIDVTKHTALIWLDCSNSLLTSLYMTNNIALTYLQCWGNQLTAEGLNALFGTLHNNASDKDIHIGGNPGADGCNRSIATAKGWI